MLCFEIANKSLNSLALPREAPETKEFSSIQGNLGNNAGTDVQSVLTPNPKQSPAGGGHSVKLTIDAGESAPKKITLARQ